MIIYNSSLVTLDYEPATDILSVALPDIRNFSISEVEHSLQKIVEHITNYDIKKLFLDSSKAVIEVDEADYRSLILKFSQNLLKTRLRKLARIASPITVQEQRASRVTEEISQTGNPPVDFRNFGNKVEAMAWLLPSS